ncbi:MAG: putative Ig domain-containing protein [Chloroflexi bacterium]|nr:putative Ig domain-containing protein [Chloroflexota bacterium]
MVYRCLHRLESFFVALLLLAGSASALVPGTAAIAAVDGNGPTGVNAAVSLLPVVRSMAVIAPNAGDSWVIGSIQKITWTYTGLTGMVRIDLSRDGGSTWSRLVPSVSVGYAGTGSYTWKVTGPATSHARIRVSSLTSHTVYGESTADFTIMESLPPLTIKTTSLPDGTVGTEYDQALVGAGGTGKGYSWSVVGDGVLPPGLNLNAANGHISGTPTEEGTYAFTVELMDNASHTATQPLSITVGSNVTNVWNYYSSMNRINYLVPDGSELWVGTTGGAMNVNPVDSTYIKYTTANSGLAHNNISSIAIDQQGNKWFGTASFDTASGGVSKFDGSTWTTYRRDNSGLGSNEVDAIAMDGVRNMWFGTDSGLSKFDGTTWTTYTTRSGPVDNVVSSVAIDEGGNKWFGSSTGVGKFDGTTWTTYTRKNSGLTTIHIDAIATDGAGNVWMGTDAGLSVTNGSGGWATYDKTNSGLPDNYVFSIAIDQQDNKWFGTRKGVSKFDGTTWTTYNTSNSGLPDSYVVSIAIDQQGNYWFGTAWDGVSKFDGSTWTTYTMSNSGLADNSVRAIAMDGVGNVWFGHYSGGVSKFDGTTWTTYTTKDGLASNMVWAIAADDTGSMWFATYSGVSRYGPGIPDTTDPQPLTTNP